MKFLGRIGTLIAALTLAIVGYAAPAQAATLHGCPDNTVCLYQWLNYGGERWQSSFFNVDLHTNNCLNLAGAQWSNGTPVADNSGSLVVNGTSGYAGHQIGVHNWQNCLVGGGLSYFNTGWPNEEPDLRDLPLANGIDAYHTITSISFGE